MKYVSDSYAAFSYSSYKFDSSMHQIGFNRKQKEWVNELLDILYELWEYVNDELELNEARMDDSKILTAQVVKLVVGKAQCDLTNKQLLNKIMVYMKNQVGKPRKLRL